MLQSQFKGQDSRLEFTPFKLLNAHQKRLPGQLEFIVHSRHSVHSIAPRARRRRIEVHAVLSGE
jgi:hypothetical protein